MYVTVPSIVSLTKSISLLPIWGGAGFVFTGENDADIMHNSVMCNINMMDVAYKRNAGRIFYSSSACIYPERNQMDALHPTTSEDSGLSGRTGQ
ncbi:MAG: NAD-dependent epimerase/dehydratase family protein [Parabacteroides sp.]